MPGNTLGARQWYEYESDSGESFSYLTDVDLGTAAGATANAANANFPRRFEPRKVYVEATVAGKKVRKAIIVPDADSTLYASEISQNITIDTIVFKTTGRVGERMTFPSLLVP